MSHKLKRKTVRWVDPYSREGWQCPEGASRSDSGMLCETTGYVLKDDRHGIKLAQSVSWFNGALNSVADVMHIPRSAIVKK